MLYVEDLIERLKEIQQAHGNVPVFKNYEGEHVQTGLDTIEYSEVDGRVLITCDTD